MESFSLKRFGIWSLTIGIYLAGCASKNPYITGGIIDLQSNRTKDAIEQFQKAIEIEPQNSDGYIWLGKAYADQKKYNAACVEFDRALEIDPAKKENLMKEQDYYWAIYLNAGIDLQSFGLCLFSIG